MTSWTISDRLSDEMDLTAMARISVMPVCQIHDPEIPIIIKNIPMKYLLILTLFFFALGVSAQIDSNNPLRTRNDSLVDRAARQYFNDSSSLGLVIGVSDHGERNYYSYRKHRGPGSLPDSNTLFEIGSITKTFISWLFADAVINHKMALDDPAKKWLPEGLMLGRDGKEITLVQLANHSSGLPGIMNNLAAPSGFNFQNPYKNYTKKYLLECLSRNGPTGAPGSHYNYSNIGPALLAMAVDSACQAPYAQLLTEKILIPLQMNRTFLVVPQQLLTQFADGHYANGLPAPHWDWDCMAPIGAIRSDAHDMLNYLEAQLNGKNKAYDLCRQPTLKVNENLSVGLAWHILDQPGTGSIFWHNGATGGFSSFAGYKMDKHSAIIALADDGKVGGTDGLGITILNQL